MSIWNRIGDLASNAAKFGGEIVGAVGAPARFAWDLGTAPWNDDDEYNGFVQPFKTAAAKAGGDVVKPLASRKATLPPNTFVLVSLPTPLNKVAACTKSKTILALFHL